MSSVNKVILIGRLGSDPEIKTFNNGGRIASFRLATSESWKDKQTGERKEATEWHSVTVQGDGLVGVVERYVKKGGQVYVEGKLKTRKWQDRDGNDRYTTEIVVGMGGGLTLLGSAGDGQRQGGSSRDDGASRADEPLDDDFSVPF